MVLLVLVSAMKKSEQVMEYDAVKVGHDAGKRVHPFVLRSHSLIL